MRVRAEVPADLDAVRELNRAAFGGPDEARIVDAIRGAVSPIVSLVADDHGTVVGHILFSPVTLTSASHLPVMGLAPMAVLPAHQRQGIGSALVRAGLDACRALGAVGVVVVGHAAYYPRFGFVAASRFGLGCEYDVPDDVFMAVELAAGALAGHAGTVRYHAAFAGDIGRADAVSGDGLHLSAGHAGQRLFESRRQGVGRTVDADQDVAVADRGIVEPR